MYFLTHKEKDVREKVCVLISLNWHASSVLLLNAFLSFHASISFC